MSTVFKHRLATNVYMHICVRFSLAKTYAISHKVQSISIFKIPGADAYMHCLICNFLSENIA